MYWERNPLIGDAQMRIAGVYGFGMLGQIVTGLFK